MSGPHATISAWNRDLHEGHYDAEMHDWKLRVVWAPKDHINRGLFHWEATRDGERDAKSPTGFAEIELAMADAEKFAKESTDARAAAQDAEIEANVGS